MRKLLIVLSVLTFLASGCASQQSSRGNANCGSKQQKKAKYHKMKQGKSPGGGMLN
jgi:uncharacterized protein YceK